MNTFVHVALCFQCFLLPIAAFNLDTEHVLIFNGENDGSYFGFSTEILQNSFGSWILVGAPKENSSAFPYITQTGGIFKCEINFTRETTHICSSKINAVESEKRGQSSVPIHHYRQSKQQLGSNMLIKKSSSQTLLACAPSYTVNFGENAPGRCVLGNLSQRNPNVTFPLFKVNTQRFGMAQIGFSASSILLPSSSYDFVLGAPGTDTGKGGFVLFDTTTKKLMPFSAKVDSILKNMPGGSNLGGFVLFDTTTKKLMPFSAKVDSILKNMPGGSNLGYATSSGRFGRKTATSPKIVLGAPHFSNEEDGHVGLVVLIVTNIRFKRYKVFKSLTGNQVGAGFGASLEVDDVNGDGYDDLLVGSPTYTGKNTDQGRVDVFYGTGNTSLVRPSFVVLLGLQKKGARFGHVIKSLGDVNGDKYNDIAVGAPYEDEEKGAVYLYHGKNGDMDSMFSQRIAASDLDSGLRGFGFHISHPVDVDGNTFNDMAVGSHLSDQAVLLRTRPIASVDCYMTFDPPSMLLNSSGLDCNTGFIDTIPCIALTLCFNFSGRALPGIDIKFRLIADVNRERQKKPNRIVFEFHNDTLDNQKEEILHLDNGVKTCTTFNAKIKATNREFYQSYEEAIGFEVTYSLHDSQYVGDVLPILDDKSDHLETQEIDIDIGCINGICRADLAVHTYPLEKRIIFGRTKEITIKVAIENSGNPAFHTNVLVQSSSNAAYLDAYQSLGEGTELIICPKVNNIGTRNASCFIDRPLFQHQSAEFRVTFNVTRHLLHSDKSLEYMHSAVNISVTASLDSPSTEVDPSNNIQWESFNIQLASNVEITGYSSPDQAVLSKDSNGVIPITYKYEVYNKGPSPLPSAEMFIDVPAYSKRDVKFSPIDKCSLIKFQSNADNLTSDGNNAATSMLPQTMNKKKKSNRNFTDVSCYDMSCFRLRCFTGQIEVEDSFRISILLNIMESELNVQKNLAGLRLQTNATIKSPQHSLFVPWKSDKSTSVILDVFPDKISPEPKSLPIWVIIVGSLGGVLLFIIILLIFWKCGFFKRRKREEIQDWKRKSARRSKYMSLTSEEVSALPGPCSTIDQESRGILSSTTDKENSRISDTSTIDNKPSRTSPSSASRKETSGSLPSSIDRRTNEISSSSSYAVDKENNGMNRSSAVDKETSGVPRSSAIDKETSGMHRSSVIDKETSGISDTSVIDNQSSGISPSSATEKETSGSPSSIDRRTNEISSSYALDNGNNGMHCSSAIDKETSGIPTSSATDKAYGQ